MSFDYVPQVGVPCPVPVLPTVFDESLSYYELLAKLWQQCKTLTDLVNAETADLNAVRTQLQEILPYLDDLSHMGERFDEIQAEITALIDRLYDESTGDITELQADVEVCVASVQNALNIANASQSVTMRTAQLAGLNGLEPVSVPASVSSHGLTFTRDAVTGWYRVTGTVSTAAAFSVNIGTYKIKQALFKIPYTGNEAGAIAYTNRNRFMCFYPFTYPISADDDFKVVFKNAVSSADEFQHSTKDSGTPQYILSLVSNNLEARCEVAAEMNGHQVDFWICPAIYPAFLQMPADGVYSNFPLPVSDVSTASLATELQTEIDARTAADTAEATTRANADTALQDQISALQTDLTTEAETRLDEDNAISTALYNQVSAERTARQNADESLSDQIAEINDESMKFTVGQLITDPDPENEVYANLFTLDPGKYYRTQNVTRVQNLPPGMTAAFFCNVVNTVAANRRRIELYPAVAARAGEFYVCLETGAGFGHWQKFEGTDIEPV